MSNTEENNEKTLYQTERHEHIGDHSTIRPVEIKEPDLHLKTWLALLAMSVLQYTSLMALVGPPTVLDYIGDAFANPQWRYWCVSVITLVQAALGPVFSSISDVFQVRKWVMIVLCTLALIGAAIIPGSGTIYRVIGGSVLIGFGLAAAPLSYAVPSEIVPRRWRSLSQGLINFFGSLGAITGPLVIGALTRSEPSSGWRTYYWIQTGLWGFTIIGIFVGYLPPTETTDRAAVMQNLKRIDWAGSAILTAALALFVAGVNLVVVYGWSSAQVLGPLIAGAVMFVAFGLYETFGTKTGIIPHELFINNRKHGWAFAHHCSLFFLEGATFFAIVTFYPAMTAALFTANPLSQAVWQLPVFAVGSIFTLAYGWASSRFRSIKWPLFVGYVIYTAGIAGLAAIEPGRSGLALAMISIVGLGLAGPLVLILSGVQLSVPHRLIATATALVVSSRTIAASLFTAAYSTTLNQRLTSYIPSYLARSVLQAGLPPTSVGPFISAFASRDQAALAQITGVTPAILGAAGVAFKQAFADAVRVVFIIAASLGAVGCMLCLLLPEYEHLMNDVVDRPLEDLHKHRGQIEKA